ncbi:conserved hypothetical protein [Actinomyces sp. oral taxon 180 str. F0310]|nr:conserved hypothetical protein [Actinomyces sp. oral taxon 180 str. F0310]
MRGESALDGLGCARRGSERPCCRWAWREAGCETGAAPADRPQDFPARGRRTLKPGPPPPAGGRQPPTSSSTPPHKPPPPAGRRQPWGGGKRNMKPRPPQPIDTRTSPPRAGGR